MGEQTDMQPVSGSKVIVKVWITVLCLIVLGKGWDGSWVKFTGGYSLYDHILAKDIVCMITYVVRTDQTKRQLSQEIPIELTVMIMVEGTDAGKQINDRGKRRRKGGDMIQNL